MKRVFLSVLLPLACLGIRAAEVQAQNTVTTDAGAAPYNALIVQEIRTMPALGGYSANHQASVRLGSAVSLGGPAGIDVEAARACPELLLRGDVPRVFEDR